MNAETNTKVPAKTHAKTPGQTVGPFFAFGTDFEKKNQVAFPHSEGAIMLTGQVTDGEGNAIPDSMIEIWQADENGVVPRERGSFSRDDYTFTGFGRAFTDDEGGYAFWTRNPGSVDGKAPFIAVVVYARGLPDKLHTRIYLPENEALLAADPLLNSLSAQERATLIAERQDNGFLKHNIRLQGSGEAGDATETVFLEFA